MSNDKEIEAEIVAKGKTAPRITPAHIEAQIVDEHYFNMGDVQTAFDEPVSVPLSCLTICILELRNGFTVTGESSCASPANYDAEIGRKIARGNAVQKIWGFEGYQLRTKLASAAAETIGL